MDYAVLAMLIKAIITFTILSVPMSMNVLMTLTICAISMLTAEIPQEVTNVLARLFTGRAKPWTVAMIVLDVLTSMSAQL